MIKRINHIGIAVSDLEEARQKMSNQLNTTVSQPESFGELLFSFIGMEGSNLELLQSTTEEGVIAKYIQHKGPGVHHIALEVDDINAELARLESMGVKLINKTAYRNAHDDLVAFIHPKSTFGVLFELIQLSDH
ncbi:VOC family protein [Desulfocicer niacini]